MTRSTRDYAGKKAKKKKPSKKKSFNPLWVVATALVGIFALGLIFLARHEQTLPTNTTPVKMVNAQKTKKPKPAPAEEPRFEFYNVLPNLEVSASNTPQKVSKLSQGYELQVASVRQYKEADRLKAQLILMGYDVRIKKFNTKRGTYNRVSVGPYPSQHAAQLAKNALAKQQYKTIIRRLAG